WPFGFRFSAFPTLSDLVRAVAGSNLFLIPRREGFAFWLFRLYQKGFGRINSTGTSGKWSVALR
ncbi:hypothetical protein, partial [Streptomyces lydicus]